MRGAPTLRRILGSALVALTLGILAVTIANGISDSYPWRLLQGVAIAAAAILVIGGVLAQVTGRLADWRNPTSEREFEALVERSERLAREDSWGEGDDDLDDDDYGEDDDDDLGIDVHDEEEFKLLVRRALDDLPLEFHRALEHVAVVVNDGGRRQRAYGLYQGDTIARDGFPDRIIIFRDTLVRDFGHNPELLKAQVTRTVRHEIAHHLGWDEPGVRGLGL
jgi:predicted Zn-dependent protease with MMP-like domain